MRKLTCKYVVVTPEDYILGMSDLTGELMRYATNGACPSLRHLFVGGGGANEAD